MRRFSGNLCCNFANHGGAPATPAPSLPRDQIAQGPGNCSSQVPTPWRTPDFPEIWGPGTPPYRPLFMGRRDIECEQSLGLIVPPPKKGLFSGISGVPGTTPFSALFGVSGGSGDCRGIWGRSGHTLGRPGILPEMLCGQISQG